MKQKHNVQVEGLDIEFATGTLAGLASGAVTIRSGETELFVSATAASALRPGQDFFPLTVDYREKFSAGGKFPGGYFKREGKPSEKEILTSRLCDRPLRPLFPKGFMNEVQVIGLLLSTDTLNEPDVLMVNAASAATVEGELSFDLSELNTLSKKTPYLCKVSPATPNVHMEDVHRAGGVLGILNELNKGGLLHGDCAHVLGKPIEEVIAEWDITNPDNADATTFYRAGPAGIRTTKAFSQDCRWDEADADREKGCIRDLEHAYSQEGGLAVLFGNLAENGCIVKTAGVDESILKFTGRARIYESQDEAVAAILNDQVVAGDAVIIRYEGPKGGPGMQEMLYPTSYLKSKGLGKDCALITDGRFSGGTSGLSIGHCSPEAASGGGIGLVQEGDTIEIDIPNRSINIAITDAELQARRAAMEASERPWRPVSRQREVSLSLKTFAMLATSADKGAVRDPSKLEDL